MFESYDNNMYAHALVLLARAGAPNPPADDDDDDEDDDGTSRSIFRFAYMASAAHAFARVLRPDIDLFTQ